MKNKIMSALALSAAFFSSCIHNSDNAIESAKEAVTPTEQAVQKYDPNTIGYMVGRKYISDEKTDDLYMYFFISTHPDNKQPEFVGQYSDNTLAFLNAHSEDGKRMGQSMTLGEWAQGLSNFRHMSELSREEQQVLTPQRRFSPLPAQGREY